MERHSTRSESNAAIVSMVTSAMMLALAILTDFICNYIPGLNWPNGGTITPAMLPLFLAGLLCGPLWGFGVSLLFGLISFFISGWGYNWVSVLLDYIVGFGVCGVCGFFYRSFHRKEIGLPILSMVLAGLLRFVSSFFSGCLVMWDANGSFLDPNFDTATVTYSAVYNLGYIIPSIVISIVLFVFLAKPLFLVMEDSHFKVLNPNEEGRSVGFLGHFDLETLSPFFGLGLIALSALSFIPTIHYEVDGSEYVVDFLALSYIALILGVLLLAYSVFLFLSKKEYQPSGIATRLFPSRNVLATVLTILSVLSIVLGALSLYVHYGIYLPLE